MENKEQFKREAFQPILEQSMLLDSMLQEQEVDITFHDIKNGDVHIKTCYGDIYTIVNALRDYSRLLTLTCEEWELAGIRKATYEYYSQKTKKIADKYQTAIGYDYDKTLEKCRKKQAKKKNDEGSDVGGDALELMLR